MWFRAFGKKLGGFWHIKSILGGVLRAKINKKHKKIWKKYKKCLKDQIFFLIWKKYNAVKQSSIKTGASDPLRGKIWSLKGKYYGKIAPFLKLFLKIKRNYPVICFLVITFAETHRYVIQGHWENFGYFLAIKNQF